MSRFSLLRKRFDHADFRGFFRPCFASLGGTFLLHGKQRSKMRATAPRAQRRIACRSKLRQAIKLFNSE